jgi:hypothetical protein
LSSGLVQRAKGRHGKVAMLADGRGLYLRIGPSGSKSWIMRYQIDGRVHDMGLGPYPEISLAEARDRCLAQRRVKVDGVDPIAARKAERLAQRLTDAKAMTFRQFAEAYILAHRAGWKTWARFCATTPTGGQVVPSRHRAGAAEGGLRWEP